MTRFNTMRQSPPKIDGNTASVCQRLQDQQRVVQLAVHWRWSIAILSQSRNDVRYHLPPLLRLFKGVLDLTSTLNLALSSTGGPRRPWIWLNFE